MSDDEDFDIGPDPTRPTLENAADAGHPFSICWSREVRSILAGLDSDRFKDLDGPWAIESPFDVSTLRLSAVIPDSPGNGGISSSGCYRDGLSTSSEHGTEHLSAALGITVGYPFLNASVTGKYDGRVSEDRNASLQPPCAGVKASRNASCRVGRVVLNRTPTLSEKAIAILQSPHGEELFRKRYGNYYVCGFALGADAGACMSASTESRSSQETIAITVAVKVLFWSESATHTEVMTSQSHSSTLSFSGYSTLDTGQPCALDSKGASPRDEEELRKQANDYLVKVRELQTKVRDVMAEVGVVDGAELPLSDCARLCRSGLVVELLLTPYARLNQYVSNARLRQPGK
ncbi:hypothetical protein B0T10DRAFT_566805 [Thelonectria olida]|uniref:Uncharacterized protein n=1 Tax=Thelonectria olida TaxID=1576542 RepID=A0A9P8VWM1_9HYPO|nr:hypothetical protein B0T10DRAFT_566805 [Thelonectria olida]